MILTDAGPLVALIDRGEPSHRGCKRALKGLVGPMLTTWPAYSEAMYMLGRANGWEAQEPLWRLVQRGDLKIAEFGTGISMRTADLMAQYHDVPMDLADAALVAACERAKIRKIFTVDRRDFLKLMGASLALAGMAGCGAPEQPFIVPYVKQPEGLVLGKPQHYATVMPLAGEALGLLVESHTIVMIPL